MSQSEFAKKVGVTQQAISKLIKQGKLPVDGKKLIMPDAEKAYHLLKAGMNLYTPEPEVFEPGENPPINSSNDKTMQDLLNAKVKKENVLGDIHLINHQKMQGELLSVDEICAQVVKVCETVRMGFINLPNKMAQILEGLSAAEIQIKLDDEVNEILEDLYSLRKEYEDNQSEDTI